MTEMRMVLISEVCRMILDTEISTLIVVVLLRMGWKQCKLLVVLSVGKVDVK